jgi:hypothetical protein
MCAAFAGDVPGGRRGEDGGTHSSRDPAETWGAGVALVSGSVEVVGRSCWLPRNQRDREPPTYVRHPQHWRQGPAMFVAGVRLGVDLSVGDISIK